MADECPQMTLQQVVTCSICLDYFTDPYMVDCGHNFCRACITRGLVETAKETSCPQCKTRIQLRNFTLNRDLARFGEISKQMNRYRDWEAAGTDLCEKHQEPLKYFCKNDRVHICPVCVKSEGHEGHDTIPVEGATLELKERIFVCLDHVRQQRDNVVNYKKCIEEEHLHLKVQLSEGKEKITTSFKLLREFLTYAEFTMHNEFSKLEVETGRVMEESVSRALEKLSSFEHILEKVAELYRLPEEELLQNAGRNLERWTREKFDKPEGYPTALKWKVWEACELHNFMDFSVYDIRVLYFEGFKLQYEKVNVTLDPDTAHPRLAVSEDRKVVQWVHQDQAVPDNPRRFDVCPCVLGSKSYFSGRIYWEVDVGIEGNWALGVAREDLGCKGELIITSRTNVFAIGKCGDRYFAFEEPNVAFPWKPLKPMRIRVCLDYFGGCLILADADQARVLYEFKPGSFDDDSLYPFFWLQREGQLKIVS